MINQEKLAYDLAQKLGERVERMTNEEGWKEVFIPMIQKKLEDAQAIVNDPSGDERIAQYNRGILALAKEILGFREEKIKNATFNMRKNVDIKMGR